MLAAPTQALKGKAIGKSLFFRSNLGSSYEALADIDPKLIEIASTKQREVKVTGQITVYNTIKDLANQRNSKELPVGEVATVIQVYEYDIDGEDRFIAEIFCKNKGFYALVDSDAPNSNKVGGGQLAPYEQSTVKQPDTFPTSTLPTVAKVTVLANSLNVRECPSVSAKILGSYKRGQEVWILSEGNRKCGDKTYPSPYDPKTNSVPTKSSKDSWVALKDQNGWIAVKYNGDTYVGDKEDLSTKGATSSTPVAKRKTNTPDVLKKYGIGEYEESSQLPLALVGIGAAALVLVLLKGK